MSNYDAIIIGTGQGGVPLAYALAKARKRTAIVERDAVGGSCVNFGCTPTKTLVHIAKVAQTVRRAAEYGVETESPKMDMSKVRELKRKIVAEFRDPTAKHLQETEHLDLICGEASFSGSRSLEIKLKEGGVTSVTGDLIFIDTGTRAFIPPIEGLDKVRYLDNASVMDLDYLPEHLTILGGGYIGLEFAQMYARFGSEVTVVEQSDRFLPREDPDIADAVLAILREDGIDFRLGTKALAASETGGNIRIETSHGDVVANELLVAVGRTPNTDDLNLAAAGVETDEKGFVKADDRLRTTAEGVYAIGDVKGGPAFTHISYDDFRVLKANLLDGGDRSIEGRMVPNVTFIDPQLGRIGLSEDEAQAKGLKFRVARMQMTDVARALEMNESRGMIKALIGGDGQILGAAVLGVEGGEIMSLIQIAMMGKLTAQDLNDAILAHPTLAEFLNNLFA